MLTIVNLTLAFFLVVIALICLYGPSIRFSKQERFLLFILMTGLFQAGGVTLAGLNLSALRLLLWILLLVGVLLIFKVTARQKTNLLFDIPIVIYGLFLTWCLIHLLCFSPDFGYGLRVFLKLLYPFLILLLARKITNIEK